MLLLFQDLNDFAENKDINLAPEYIISDFELAVIHASEQEFPLSKSKGYYLFVSFMSKYMEKMFRIGLSNEYRTIQVHNISKSL